MGLIGKILKKVVVGAAVVGAGLVTAGAVNTHKAKKINREAEDIRNQAMHKYNRANADANNALKAVGESELKVINKFTLFCECIEKIQGRPDINTNYRSIIDLPKYDLKEIKRLPEELGVVIGGAVGAGAGALVGLAAYGATAAIASPALLGGGIVICIKGAQLKKQAIKNVEQAQILSNQIDEVCMFYSKVIDVSYKFQSNLNTLYRIYDYHLEKIYPIVQRKRYWYEYTQDEKKWVENTILLTRLLHEMCKTRVILKEREVEVVNEQRIYQLGNESTRLIQSLG